MHTYSPTLNGLIPGDPLRRRPKADRSRSPASEYTQSPPVTISSPPQQPRQHTNPLPRTDFLPDESFERSLRRNQLRKMRSEPPQDELANFSLSHSRSMGETSSHAAGSAQPVLEGGVLSDFHARPYLTSSLPRPPHSIRGDVAQALANVASTQKPAHGHTSGSVSARRSVGRYYGRDREDGDGVTAAFPSRGESQRGMEQTESGLLRHGSGESAGEPSAESRVSNSVGSTRLLGAGTYRSRRSPPSRTQPLSLRDTSFGSIGSAPVRYFSLSSSSSTHSPHASPLDRSIPVMRPDLSPYNPRPLHPHRSPPNRWDVRIRPLPPDRQSDHHPSPPSPRSRPHSSHSVYSTHSAHSAHSSAPSTSPEPRQRPRPLGTQPRAHSDLRPHTADRRGAAQQQHRATFSLGRKSASAPDSPQNGSPGQKTPSLSSRMSTFLRRPAASPDRSSPQSVRGTPSQQFGADSSLSRTSRTSRTSRLSRRSHGSHSRSPSVQREMQLREEHRANPNIMELPAAKGRRFLGSRTLKVSRKSCSDVVREKEDMSERERQLHRDAVRRGAGVSPPGSPGQGQGQGQGVRQMGYRARRRARGAS